MRAINSIKNQEYRNFEIILVNDGSDNRETLDLINSLKEIKIINQKNTYKLRQDIPIAI